MNLVLCTVGEHRRYEIIKYMLFKIQNRDTLKLLCFNYRRTFSRNTSLFMQTSSFGLAILHTDERKTFDICNYNYMLP